MRFFALLAAGLVLATATPAHAQKPEAVAAFSRGKDLLAQGKTAEACSEFELSMRLDPQNGTLYNLALCHEQLGKVASAWAEMKELSETDKNAARAKDAGKRAVALEKKLTRMRIVVTAQVDGLVVKRDNVDVTVLVDKETPVDPASYTFVASAPGFEDASLTADLTAPGQTIDVTIPALAEKKDKPDPEPKGAVATDPYASRLTLRPLALTKGVYELGMRGVWVASGNFEQDPLDVALSARGGFGRIQVYGGVQFHTRYEQVTATRPTITRTAQIGADYVITPLLTAGIDIRKQHPFGGDRLQGFDFRSDLEGKRIVTPNVALIGAGGILYKSQQNSGQAEAQSEFAFVGDGTVQLSPVDRFTVSGFVRMQLNVSGDIYADTVVLDIGAIATVVLTRNLDAYIYTALAALPRADNNDYRTLIVGATYRIP